MRCADIDRLSSEYLDGELDANRSSALRGHLRECERCRVLVDELSAVRDMAAQLDGAMDPPKALWNQIENELAESEIADAGRGRLWLWWQGALSAARSHAVFAVAATAIVVTAVWVGQRRGERTDEARGGATEVASFEPTTFAAGAGDTAPATTPTHKQAVSLELADAEKQYQGAVAELLDALHSAKKSWTADRQRAFDQSLSGFEQRIERERANLVASSASGPAAQDGLRDVYREKIEFLQDAAFAELEAE